ncbi:MAG: helix-turn-helix domain-containing protein [Candidatus Helarchaeota archaeon]
MEKPHINKVLMDILNLDEFDVITYLTILNYGPLTMGEISSYSKLEYLSLTLCIEKLKKKNLIVELPGLIKNYQALPPYKGYLEKLNKLEQNISKIINKINSIAVETEQKIGDIANNKIDTVKSEFDSYIQSITSKSELLNKNIQDNFKITKGEISKQLNVINKELQSFAEKYIQEFDKILSDIKSEIVNKISNLTNEVRDISRKGENDLNMHIDEFIQMSKNDTQKAIESATTIFIDVLNNFSNDVINLRQTFTQKIINFLNTFRDSSIELEKLERNFVKEFNEPADKIFYETQNLLKNHIERALNENLELTSSLNDNFLEVMETIHNTIETEIDNLHTKEIELIGGLLKVINDMISNFDKDVVESLSGGKNKFIEFSDTIEQGVNELFGEYFNSLNKNIETIKKDFKKNITFINTSIINLSDELNKSIIDGLGQHLEKFSNISKEFELNLNDNLKDNVELYESSAKNFLNEFSEVMKTKLTNARAGLNKLKNEILSRTEETQKQFQENLIKLNDELKDVIKSQIELVNTNIVPTQTRFSEVINGEIKHILEDTRSFNSESISFLQDSQNMLNDQISLFKDGIENLVKRIFKEIDLQASTSREKLSNLEENFKKLYEKRIQTIIDTTKRFETKLQEEFQNQFNIISQIATIIEDNLNKNITEQTSNYNLLLENIKSAISVELTREITNSEELLSTLLTDFDKTLNKSLEFIKSNVSEMISNITSTIISISDENRNLNETYSQKIEELIKSYNISFNQKNESLINKVEIIGNTYSDNTIKDFQDKLTDFTQKLSKIKSEFISTIDKMESTIKKRINTHGKLFNNVLMNINKNLTGTLVELKNKSATSFLSLKDTSNANFSEYISNLKTGATELSSLFTDSFNTLRNNIKEFIRTLQNQSISLYNENVVSGIKLMKDVRDTFESSIESSSSKLKEGIKDPQSKMENILTKNAQNIEKIQKLFSESVKNSVQWITEEYQNLNSNLIEAIDESIKNHADQNQLLLNNSKENIEIRINDQKQNINNLLIDIQKKISKFIEDQKNELQNKKDMSQGIFTTITSEFLKVISDQVSKTSKIFIDQINELQKETSDSELLLRYVWQELQNKQKLRESGTWELKTLSAVIEHIKDMISRTTSSIILLIPDPNNIPFDELNKIKPAIDVRLYTNLSDTLIKSEKVTKLLDKDNILIFNIKENFYGAFRDKQEVLIAPGEEDDKAVSGIISVQEGHLNLFFNIIGPIYDSKAVKISK